METFLSYVAAATGGAAAYALLTAARRPRDGRDGGPVAPAPDRSQTPAERRTVVRRARIGKTRRTRYSPSDLDD